MLAKLMRWWSANSIFYSFTTNGRYTGSGVSATVRATDPATGALISLQTTSAVLVIDSSDPPTEEENDPAAALLVSADGTDEAESSVESVFTEWPEIAMALLAADLDDESEETDEESVDAILSLLGGNTL